MRVSLPAHPYDILIDSGILERLPELIRSHMPRQRYALICDSTVHQIFAGTISAWESDLNVALCVFPAGETNKNRTTWADLTDQLISAGVGRDGAVIAFGGGVTGDLAGFVAATFLRGIPYAQVPTTLLAMIDSSIGGKTGVDTPAGKNLVGAFHQPEVVITDVRTLETLPQPQLESGLAEALKHGAIRDRAYFDFLTANAAEILATETSLMLEVVRRSAEIKAEIVMEDQFEGGIRATLNFGHTIGHGIEAAMDYALDHGRAVAIGMVAEALIGTELGMTDPSSGPLLNETLERFGLPTRMPSGLSSQSVMEYVSRDKKNRQGEVRFAPISHVGKSAVLGAGRWTSPLPLETAQKILDQHL